MAASHPIPETTQALAQQKPLLWRAFAFSVIAGLLVLAPTWYMLEVYDRVVNSRSLMTLAMLTLLVLMLLAVAGAIFGWFNMQRARTAEAEAQNSRNNAEKLVSFLIEDFYAELAPTGRLETLGKLAQIGLGGGDAGIHRLQLLCRLSQDRFLRRLLVHQGLGFRA